MDEPRGPGSLAATPFPFVLAECWKKRRSGRLTVESGGRAVTLSFDRGALTIERSLFPEPEFRAFLLRAGALDTVTLGRVEDRARDADVPFVRAALDVGALPARRLWGLLEEFARERVYPLFAADAGSFAFVEARIPPEEQWIGGVPVPELVLEGVRRVSDPERFGPHLPAGDEPLQVLSPYHAEILGLDGPERWLLRALETPRSLNELGGTGILPPLECRRAVFAFLALGLAGPAGVKARGGRTPHDLSLVDVDRCLALFNEKSACVFRYVSKELGPVALNILEKSVEDVRARLDPAVQSFALKPDGRFESRSPLRLNAGLGSEGGRRSFLRSLDEVLAAEVLAVRRNLGGDHESVLVRHLDRIGADYA